MIAERTAQCSANEPIVWGKHAAAACHASHDREHIAQRADRSTQQ